jgi:uncharacterized protein (TIGR00290 family)
MLAARESFDIIGLLTTYREADETVAMHETPLELVKQQAAALGLPLYTVGLPPNAANEVYEARMGETLERLRATHGVERIICGDIALEDVRDYREARLAEAGFRAHFPLWGEEPSELADYVLAHGIEAVVTAVSKDHRERVPCGARFTESFLASLPDDVDPCGENGEFHSFVYNMTGFSAPLEIDVEEIYETEWHWNARLRW